MPFRRLCVSLSAVLLSWCSVALAGQTMAAVTPVTAAPHVTATAPVTSPPSADPPLLPPSEQLADTLSARGRYLLAIRTYEALPPTAPVMNKLGVACLHMLMFDRARSEFEQAIRLDPRYAEAFNNLGTLAHSLGDWHRAEKMYKRALQLKPDAPSTLKNLGTLYYAEHKFKKGDQAYERALRQDPGVLEHSSGHDIPTMAKGQTVGEVHYHMALSYAQAGSYPMALTYLRKAISEGFHDRNRLLHEKQFADLRTQPTFLQLVDDLKKD